MEQLLGLIADNQAAIAAALAAGLAYINRDSLRGLPAKLSGAVRIPVPPVVDETDTDIADLLAAKRLLARARRDNNKKLESSVVACITVMFDRPQTQDAVEQK